jgi:hypothetical protein
MKSIKLPEHRADNIYFSIRQSRELLPHAMPCLALDFDPNFLGNGVSM